MAISVDVLSNAGRNAVSKRVINPGLNNLRSNVPTRWGGPGPGAGVRAEELEHGNWSPYVLNRQSFIEIYTVAGDIGSRFKGAETAKSVVEAGVAAAVGNLHGISTSLGATVEAFISDHIGDIREVLAGVTDNGGYMSFKSWIEKYPDLSIQNTYAQKNILGKVANFASNIGESIGGLSPNMQLHFQVPKMWNSATLSNLEFECNINSHSLHHMPVTPTIDVDNIPKSKQEADGKAHGGGHPTYTMDTNTDIEANRVDELSLMNAALVALMIGSPRAGVKYIEGRIGADAIIKSPAIVDVAINGILFPTMNVQSVSVTFGDAFGPNGFPLEAKVSWSFQFPLMPTREDFNKLRNALYAYDPHGQGSKAPQLATDALILDTGRHE